MSFNNSCGLTVVSIGVDTGVSGTFSDSTGVDTGFSGSFSDSTGVDTGFSGSFSGSFAVGFTISLIGLYLPTHTGADTIESPSFCLILT